MNKILCIIIALSLVFSMGIPAFSASDYSGHWAESIIDSLLKDNIISGDGSGIRPDDTISRSEFVTVINKAFSYSSDGATVNFPDVSVDKWYFSQFLAAKKAGYLTGDDLGNANPEKLITRAEAAVILCRILGFKVTENIESFSDDADIPSWSREAVYALCEEGVLKGYPDGSFKATYNMTRAEAFSVVYNVQNVNAPSADNQTPSNSVNITTDNISVRPAGGSGGGGGGGGGGGSSSGTVYEEFKITREDSENYMVAWTELSSASSYTVKLTSLRTGVSKEEIVSACSVNYKEMADFLSLTGRKSKEEFTITITSDSASGSKSATSSVSVSYVAVPEPSDVMAYCEPINETEKIYVSFTVSPLASSYDFKIDFGAGLQTVPYNVVNGKAVADITSILADESKDEYEYSVQGISIPDSGVLNSEIKTGKIYKPLYFKGAGTKNDPYIIKNIRHFDNIRKNNSAYFTLAADLTLPASYAPFEFNGSLIGDNPSDLREITVNIVGASGVNTGLFTSSTAANTTVKYIALKGSVKGSGKYVGGFFGSFTVQGTISYCENYATIESSGDRCGGFVGIANKAGALSHLVNYGVVKTPNGAGGIGGEVYGGTYLANLGKVNGGWYVGGIFGVCTNSVSYCFNKGEITGGFNVGGIIGCGSGSGKTVTACYNTGNITQTMAKYGANQSGGILGGVSAASSTYKLSSCYSTGTVAAASGAFTPIMPTYEGSSPMTASDCVYLSQTAQADTLDGTAPVTADELKAYVFATEQLAVNTNTSYPYHEIKDFPDIVIPTKLATPSANVSTSRTSVSVNITGQAETSSYKLLISKNSDYSNAVTVTTSGGSSVSLNIISYLSDYDTYYVKIIAAGNGVEWIDSDGYETTCQKPYYKLQTPSISVSRPEADIIKLNIEGQADTEEYKVYISVNSDFSSATEITINGGATATLDISQYIETLNIKYYIKVEAIGDGEEWHNSDAATTDYTKEAFKIDKPVLDGEVYYTNGGYQIAWDEITTSNLTGYTLTVKNDQSQIVYEDNTILSSATSINLAKTAEMPYGEKTYTVELVANGTDSNENSDALTFTIDTRFGGGNATDGYYICNEVHFKNISETGKYILRENIDLTDCNYAPMENFKGTLAGLDNKLKTITVNILANEINVGLFKKADGATFKYIKLSGSVESEKNSSYSQCGGFVANGFGTLTFIGCVNDAEITSIKSKTGGFAGQGETIVLDSCANSGDITVSNGGNAGGFAGKATTVYNNNSVNTGNVTANSNYGDIVGSGTVETGLPLAYTGFIITNNSWRVAV